MNTEHPHHIDLDPAEFTESGELAEILLEMAHHLTMFSEKKNRDSAKKLLFLGLVSLPRNAFYQDTECLVGPMIRSWLSRALQADSCDLTNSENNFSNELRSILQQIFHLSGLNNRNT